MSKPSVKSLQTAAQCWCDEETEMIEMDTRLARAFAKRLDLMTSEFEAKTKTADDLILASHNLSEAYNKVLDERDSLQKENVELKENVRFYKNEWERACNRDEYTQEMLTELIELRAQLAIAVAGLKLSANSNGDNPAAIALAKIDQKPVAVVEVGCIERSDNGWSADEHITSDEFPRGTLIVWGKETNDSET